MLSTPHSALTSSAVFRRIVLSSSVCLIIAACVIWLVYGVSAIRSDQAAKADVQSTVEHLIDIYIKEGSAALREEFLWDESVHWHADYLFEIMEEDDMVLAWLDGNGESLAGYAAMDPPMGFSDGYLEHDELDDHQLTFYRQTLADGSSIIAGRFDPGDLLALREFLSMATLLLALVFIPLVFTVGYFLSRSVRHRLTTIATAANQIDENSLVARIPVSDRNDEFDQLAQSVNHMLNRVGLLTQNMHHVSMGVAHDIKTPIANIAGRLELIHRDINNPSAIEDHLEASHEHIASLRRILDALLRLGEIEAGERKSAFQCINFSALVEDVCDSFSVVMTDANKTLSPSIRPGIHVIGDSELLTQALTNLIENLVEHTRDGAHARIQLSQDNSSVHLRVVDDGPGIPLVDQTHIFTRFYRTDRSRNTQGSGLGLSLVNAIADLHDGSITLHSNSHGSEFCLELPAAQDSAG